MSAVILPFVPRAPVERDPDVEDLIRQNREILIRQARAIYESIFPATIDYTELADTAPAEYVAPESDPA